MMTDSNGDLTRNLELRPIGELKPNPSNPRFIKDDKFRKLVQSIRDFPEMLKIKPIVVDEDNIILAGNMRWRACREAGLNEVPTLKADNFTEEQKAEFVIKDNVSAGAWDWDLLSSWDDECLDGWGLDVPQVVSEDVDYSALEDSNLDRDLDEMEKKAYKGLQIEFEPDDYEIAYLIANKLRAHGCELGKLVLSCFRDEERRRQDREQ